MPTYMLHVMLLTNPHLEQLLAVLFNSSSRYTEWYSSLPFVERPLTLLSHSFLAAFDFHSLLQNYAINSVGTGDIQHKRHQQYTDCKNINWFCLNDQVHNMMHRPLKDQEYVSCQCNYATKSTMALFSSVRSLQDHCTVRDCGHI